MSAPENALSARQAPGRGEISLDHVAHFVPDMGQAAPALEKLGFTLTPFSIQSHRPEPGAALVPAGTANRCVMFGRGYIECLTPVGDTPVAGQLRAAIQRYIGVHLIAFGTAAPELDHARLAANGYAPLAPVALQRQIGTPHGEDTARFTVVRVPPGTMAEGRIQFCQHHTPDLVWQERWLTHENHAAALTAVIVCVDDPAAAAQRYARFTGLAAAGSRDSWRIDTRHGRLLFCTPRTVKREFNVEAATLPWIVGYVLASSRMAATRVVLAGTGFPHGDLAHRRAYVVPPSQVGGLIVFEAQNSPAFDFRPDAI